MALRRSSRHVSQKPPISSPTPRTLMRAMRIAKLAAATMNKVRKNPTTTTPTTITAVSLHQIHTPFNCTFVLVSLTLVVAPSLAFRTLVPFNTHSKTALECSTRLFLLVRKKTPTIFGKRIREYMFSHHITPHRRTSRRSMTTTMRRSLRVPGGWKEDRWVCCQILFFISTSICSQSQSPTRSKPTAKPKPPTEDHNERQSRGPFSL